MAFYSFRTHSAQDVVIPSHLVTIGEGFDVFNTVVTDLDEFMHRLGAEGVKVLEVIQLDVLEQVPADPAIQAAMSGTIPLELIAAGVRDPLIEELTGEVLTPVLIEGQAEVL